MSVDLLARVPLLAGLSAADLQRLHAIARAVSLEEGQELFGEGSEGDAAFVLLEGELEVTKSSGGRPILLAVRKQPGDVVGEMALLEKTPRMATVRARTRSSLLEIPQGQFDELLATSPSAARALFRTVISRWRETQGMLRQSERMAQLGTLTAGVAHELNNPAAAAKRGIGQLRDALEAVLALPDSPSPGLAGDLLLELSRRARERAERPAFFPGSLERSDRESDVQAWLSGRGFHDPWDLAPQLVSLDLDVQELSRLEAGVPAGHLEPLLRRAAATYTLHSLLKEIGEGVSRISDIVKALRAYSFLDQAPLNSVDVHESLENALLLLRHKLENSVEVRREYGADVPTIEAYGSELGQVWTNLIDNAAQAGAEHGRIVLRTRHDGEYVVVEIEDNGRGIPAEIHDRVFDAFFTTKQPGQGTGLGLSISYGIVVNRHRGSISFRSEPGRTCFEVRLPVVQGRAGSKAAPSGGPRVGVGE